MPCCLTPSTGTKEDFLGTTGCQVTLRLDGPSGADAVIVHARYAGEVIPTDPPQFKVKSGAKMLVIVVEASQVGALVRLVEICDIDSEQVLDRFHFDPMIYYPGWEREYEGVVRELFRQVDRQKMLEDFVAAARWLKARRLLLRCSGSIRCSIRSGTIRVSKNSPPNQPQNR